MASVNLSSFPEDSVGKDEGGRGRRVESEVRRGGKSERRKGIRVATWNVGSLTGKAAEIVDVLKKRRVEIACVQETKWKGEKAKELIEGFKVIYVGESSKRNGVGIILKSEWKDKVVQVVRVSDRLIRVQLATGDGVVNVISGYAPQVGCSRRRRFSGRS